MQRISKKMVKAEMIIRLCQQYQINFLLSTFQNFIVENIINIKNLESILSIADIYELDLFVPPGSPRLSLHLGWQKGWVVC